MSKSPAPKPFRPMLACPAPSEGLTFPYIASTKLDGVRCLIKDGQAMSRKLEPLPNKHVQRMLGHPLLEGLDGELVVGAPNAKMVFSDTQSAVMTIEGEPACTFWVFDTWNSPADWGYEKRLQAIAQALGVYPYSAHPWLRLLPHTVVNDGQELQQAQQTALDGGFEGLIIRSPDGPYKQGRSTAKQGWMMKLKEFSDSEARIVACVEQMSNENEATIDERGYTKRGHSQEGKVPTGMLGAFTVEDIHSGVRFNIGTGFTAEERLAYWAQREVMVGLIVKYKHFEIGAKVAPRHPVFMAFRNERDIGDPK